MINRIIRASLENRALVLLLAFMLTAIGVHAVLRTPVDALPDLSDVQVIVRTPFPGQAPRVVEDQVTYPLTTALLSVPGAATVRGYSFYGDSFVSVLFADGTDPYWARSRVLEYLSQAAARLPEGVRPALGPDATGVGWIYQYALIDRTGAHDLAQLRSLQDWFLKFELQALDGVAEVATIGGMVKQYQVVVDPLRLRGYGIPLMMVEKAIREGNQEVGGSVVEMAEAEYMVRATGYVKSIGDLERIPVMTTKDGTAVLLRDVAEVRLGPEMRRGIGELDGEGEAVGGVVVMRNGDNARETIVRVKAKLDELRAGLPQGVEIVTTYDRSSLIQRAVDHLKGKLLDEFLVVALVCFVFLFHVRSGLIVVIVTPIAVASAFIVMRAQGINANVMSLGGIAIAIGTLVDAAIVMIENVHKKLEHAPDESRRMETIYAGCREVGPSLFFSLMIVALSFLPVFTLEAQEGRLFAPLAYTKTYAMVAASLLSITLVPVLIWYLVRGRIRPEHANPVNRAAAAIYRPFLEIALRHPWAVTAAATVLILATLWPASRLGREFMPELDEGDLLYMPTTLPGLSTDAARSLLQQTDRLIKTVPEVERVFGKAGRAESATDPAPIEMFETTIMLKPRDQWRDGMTPEKLKAELDALVKFPGVSNAWGYPIKTRIDMLATGIRTPVGIKIMGPDLATIQQLGQQIETIVKAVPGTTSVYAERTATGRYVDIDIDRVAAGRYGLNIKDVQDIVGSAVGGMTVSYTVEGLERYPINLRYPQDFRDSLEKLRQLPIVAPTGANVTLQDVARVDIADGPGMIRSENARPSGWVFVDIQGRDLGGYVDEAKARIADELALPAGYSLSWSGQYEYLQRAVERLQLVVPLTLGIIVLLLYLNFRNVRDVGLILFTLPFALVGGVWLLYFLDYDLSIAAVVGFIALAGVAAETGVVMVMYLEHSWAERRACAAVENRAPTRRELREAIVDGALLRLRPKLMTVITIIVGLLPIMWGSGTGAAVMRRIAAPMVGGMVSATVLTLVIIPSLYLLLNGWKLRDEQG
ncbi:MAG: efflux RND transporter permease subunit [Steroidobacteraceae bacterium]|nr:efflux RND transporter permease subunit [Steroidobacteraceae bacterium]MBP7012835.1 efflux RND transporter permease subunit [Steroidobacteraceae bacterium]